MKYQKLLKLILEFINDNKKNVEIFCDDYMDDYYNFNDDLEQEVPQNIYEMFDDINAICDLYEPNEEIRLMDKYCVNEITLRNKVGEIYRKIVQLIS